MAGLIGSLSVIGLIFGGCCTNVYTLEAIFKSVDPKHEQDAGLLITFVQFVLAALLSLPTQLGPRIRQSTPQSKAPVPFSSWVMIATMFYAVNMLNNWAFAFHISVPVHIILRSFGSVWTMLAGYLKGKRYTPLQVFSVMVLTAGVLVSAYADAIEKGKDLSATSTADSRSTFLTGLLILLLAQILSAYMGVFVQDIYATHSTTWRDNLFWSHALSLPLFLPLASVLRRQYAAVAATPPLAHDPLASSFRATVVGELLSVYPSGLVFLALNAATQLLCISGVNVLSSRSSAVTVTIVLNVRKLVSFLASTLLFGHSLGATMALGAALVFGSGALYGWESSWRVPRARAAAVRDRKQNGQTKKEL